MLTLTLLVLTAAPLPYAKPPKPESPMPTYPVPGRYIVRWGLNQGEGHLLPGGFMWYMCGSSLYFGRYEYNHVTRELGWWETHVNTMPPFNPIKYTFLMDSTGLKGATEHGTIIHFQRWNPNRKDFTRGPTKIAE